MDIKVCTVVDSRMNGTSDTVYKYVLDCRDGECCVFISMDYLGQRSEYTHTDFASSTEAKEFYELACKNLATPIDAPYVFEDNFGKASR